MGRKCCVFGCKSNYNNSAYMSSFLFPKDVARRQQWIDQINREDFEPTPTTVVCILHFEERYIIRTDHATRDDGSILSMPRHKPKLTTDAIPTIFPVPSDEESRKPRPGRKRSKKMKAPSKLTNVEDEILSFETFKAFYKSKLRSEWLSVENEHFILIYKLDISECPRVNVSLKIYRDLTVGAWHVDSLIDSAQFINVLGKQNKCDMWSKLNCLLIILDSVAENEMPLQKRLDQVINFLTEYKMSLENKKCQITSDEVRDLLQDVANSLQPVTSHFPIITKVVSKPKLKSTDAKVQKPKSAYKKKLPRKRKMFNYTSEDTDEEMSMIKVKLEAPDTSYPAFDDEAVAESASSTKLQEFKLENNSQNLIILKKYSDENVSENDSYELYNEAMPDNDAVLAALNSNYISVPDTVISVTANISSAEESIEDESLSIF